MLAKDVMTTGVVTIEPETTVREIATVLADRGISAVPVVDKGGAILGIVSEGDLIHRQEIGTDQKKSSWWLLSLSKAEEAAVDNSKSHGMHAHDIMTRDVVTVSESTSLNEIADTLETKRIKRVPVVRDGVLVGIVSRANIVQAIAARPKGAHAPVSGDDRSIRGRVTDNLKDQLEPAVEQFRVRVGRRCGYLWHHRQQCRTGRVADRRRKHAGRGQGHRPPGHRQILGRRDLAPAI